MCSCFLTLLTFVFHFLQDWCQALTDGEDVPEVHLVWSCRRIEEIELVGEALPSLLASAAPAGAESLFKMSLFCSGKVMDALLSLSLLLLT